MRRQKEEEENNNNDRNNDVTKTSSQFGGFPVGASHCDALKFVDDSASEVSHRSSNN